MTMEMTLKDFILESVSRRGNSTVLRRYTEFPKTIIGVTGKKNIIEWLDTNGFTKIKPYVVEELIKHYYSNNREKCYQTGSFDRDKATHWIRFYDGKTVFFIRTCDRMYTLIHPELRVIAKVENGGQWEDITPEDIDRYFSSMGYYTVKENLLEAISRRGNSRIMEFPEDNTDKDGILEWLEMHNYKKVEYDYKHSSADDVIIEYKKRTGRNCYCTGIYGHDDASNWIRILKDDHIYFIRTNDYMKNYDFCECQFTKSLLYNQVTFEYIRNKITE